MGGMLAGAIVFGRLSDRYGRRALLIWSYLQMGVAGTCVAFLPSFGCYCAFRFLSGMAVSGIQLNSISLILEWMLPKWRTLAVTMISQGFPLAQLLLAGMAYGIRDWRWLQFAMSAPFLLILLYSWFLPESARWLVLNGRSPEAIKNLRRVAGVNGKEKEGEELTVELVEAQMKEAFTVTPSTSILDLVRTPGMRRITCCLVFVCFPASMGYYALAMNLPNFGVSIFLIQVFFGAVDIIAKQTTYVAMDCCGRRVTLAFTLISAGLLIIGNIFVPQEMPIVRTVLATVGKGCFSGAFTCILMYSGELYPTVLRQTGLGILSTDIRVAAMLAPVVHMTSRYASFLPAIIYGAGSLAAGVTACMLTEVRNIALADTIEEVERRERRKPLREEKEEVPLTRKGGPNFPKAI